MLKTWLAYMLVTGLTGNPLVGLLVAAAVLWGAEGWFRGRFWSPAPVFQRWTRIRRLRDDIAANPHDAIAKAQLGGMLVDSRPAEARTLLQEVHDRYPDLALPGFHLGVARLNLGDTDGGRAAIEHALSVKGDLGYGEPMIRLGDHLVRLGRYPDAIGCYEGAIKVHRSSSEAYFKLGRARQRAGDKAGAKAAYHQAIEVSRGAPPYKKRIDRPWRVRAWLWSQLSG